ncbi:MAG: CaiB/BaiF CoA-transferase family protein [Pseudomonadota bacterium]
MLDGIRVIEIEGLGPAPFAGMLLADLGADVIVIHRRSGDRAPGQPDRPILDRGKRSIALDLKDPDDFEIASELIGTADALIEGFRPGVMERLGLGPESVRVRNPALVYGRMTGWGQTGPRAQQAGHDLNYIALAGALWHASPAGQRPQTPPTLVGDIGGGALYLVTGLLAGLLRARATGQGTVVDAAIYDGAAHMMNLLMTLRQSGGFSDGRGTSLLDGPHWSRTYRTQDGGFISVQCLEPKFYTIFLETLGLADDPDFAEQFRPDLWPAQSDRLEDLFRSEPRAHWEALFDGTDACVAPVLPPHEALNHPMSAVRQTWIAPEGTLQAAPAPRFDGARPSVRPVPKRDGNRAEILSLIGR